jgi:membrane protease YdiL (CAAX protease family)
MSRATETRSINRITFESGVQTLLGFGLAFVAILAVFVPLNEFTLEASAGVWYLQEVILFLLIAGITLALLRKDGVEMSDIGLSAQYLLPAVLAFGVIYAGVNVVGIGLAGVFDLPWGLALLTATVPAPFDSLPASWTVFILLQFFIGLVEEFTIRGYFQNKVIAFLGGDSHLRIAAGVLTASVVFGVLHTPGALLSGAGIAGVVGVVVSRTLTGVFFGTFYELTRNVYFVALLHGFGNTWPLLIDWSTWSGTPLIAFFVGVTFFYFGVTLGYRYWAADTALTLTVRRTDAGSGQSQSESNHGTP